MYVNDLFYGTLITISKRWRLFATIFLSVVMLGVIYLTVTTKKYESVAELVVRFKSIAPEVERRPVTELTPADRTEIVRAHAAILSSHDLAQETIAALGLAQVYPDIAEAPPAQGTAMDLAVRRLLGDLAVEVGMQDNIIKLSLRHADPAMAQRLVMTMIDLYVTRQTKIYHDPHESFLASEVKQSGAKLAEAQAALEQFRGQWQITDYDREIEDLLKQRGEIDTNLHAAQAALAQAQERQQRLRDLMRGIPEKQAAAAGGEKYRALDEAYSRLADLRTKQSQMLATYDPKGPAMAALNAGIATAEKELKARRADLARRSSEAPNTVYQTLQTDYLRASADAESNAQPVRVLTQQIAGIDQRLADLRRNRGLFDDLVREYRIAEETYRSLSMQHADARVKGSLNDQRISPATVLSEPTLPYRPVRPRGLITLLACLMGGTILATIAAMIREAIDDRFTTAEQVVSLLDLPVLASLERQPHRPPLQLLPLGETE